MTNVAVEAAKIVGPLLLMQCFRKWRSVAAQRAAQREAAKREAAQERKEAAMRKRKREWETWMGNKKAGGGEVTGTDYENGKILYKTLEHLATDIIRYIMLYTNEIGRYVLDRYLGCPHLERIPNGTWGEN